MDVKMKDTNWEILDHADISEKENAVGEKVFISMTHLPIWMTNIKKNMQMMK